MKLTLPLERFAGIVAVLVLLAVAAWLVFTLIDEPIPMSPCSAALSVLCR